MTMIAIGAAIAVLTGMGAGVGIDRKSIRLNSSHSPRSISYAVFCLKKKN